VRWWEAGERPEAELLAVMKHVRFAVMAASFLHGTVVGCPALRSVEGKDILLHAMMPAVDGTKVVPRSGFGPRLIYVSGGLGTGDTKLSTVDLYDPQNASWKQLASMSVPRYAHGCVAFGGKFYAVGGFGDADQELQALDTAEVYDPQTDGWQPLAKMTTSRSAFGLAAVDGKIYAIGGWCAEQSVMRDSVEAYDPQLGSWALVASMSVKRIFHASVVLDGKIYAMGGITDGRAVLDTVEMYNPQADSWQRLASMPRGLCKHAAAAMGGKIYVTGGSAQGDSVFAEVPSLDSVYVYDPQADAWTELASMNTARRVHASAAVGGKLYVFGGMGMGCLDTTEVYDPASGSWAQLSSLTSSRHSLVAVAL